MQALIEEYGKVLIYAIVGMIVLEIVVLGIGSWFIATYPDIESNTGIISEVQKEEPIIIAENIEIEKKDEMEVIDFSQYITAYNDTSMATLAAIEIIGQEQVDVTTPGIYQIICSATNSVGCSFSKRIPVLIY